MHSGVHALVGLYFHGNWLGPQVLAIAGFEAFGLGPENVSLFARGNQLLEFAHMIGVDFPTRVFVAGPPNFHRHAVHRTIIRPPYGPKDHSKIVRRRRLLGVGWSNDG